MLFIGPKSRVAMMTMNFPFETPVLTVTVNMLDDQIKDYLEWRSVYFDDIILQEKTGQQQQTYAIATPDPEGLQTQLKQIGHFLELPMTFEILRN